MAKRILDEITKRKFLGLLPFSPDSFVTWTPDDFLKLPLDLQPKFNIRPFNKEIIKQVRESIQAGKFDIDIARESIKYAVTAWVDLVDLGSEMDIPYSKEAFDSLPDALIWVLYLKAKELTFGLSDEEKESLESQPVSESVPLSKAAPNADLIKD